MSSVMVYATTLLLLWDRSGRYSAIQHEKHWLYGLIMHHSDRSTLYGFAEILAEDLQWLHIAAEAKNAVDVNLLYSLRFGVLSSMSIIAAVTIQKRVMGRDDG